VRKSINLPLSSADVTESGSLNLPEPSGPHRPVMGMLYLYTVYIYIYIYIYERYWEADWALVPAKTGSRAEY
jgi:hypothetical protein